MEDTNKIPENTEKTADEMMISLLKKQLWWSRLTGYILCGMLVFMVVGGGLLGHRVYTAVVETEKLVSNVNGLVSELDGVDEVMDNLGKTASDLAEADIPGLLVELEGLVVSAEETLSETKGKIEEMDIATLNKAIAELEAIIQPLARLFGKN